MKNGTALYGCGFTTMVEESSHSTSAPYSCMVHIVRSMYGRDIISPVRCSVSPFFITGPIISSAEIYCEDTLPAMSSLPPSSCFPLTFSGGNPSSPMYSISAPRSLSASTNTETGRCFMRSVPVMTCSPLPTASSAVVKRIAVPAAFTSIS